jgi:hypothetical protein
VNVTIAAGFRCNEGIVLCADTQETISGYIKGYSGKIVTHFFGAGHVSIAGSGTTDYIKMANDKLVENLSGLNDFKSIKDQVENNLITFFDVHLSRWAGFPDNERPNIELLLAISAYSGGFGLFHWSGTAFHQTHGKAIGAGILLANSMMQEYCGGNLTLGELTNLAIFVLHKVKNNVDACGGNTHMVLIKKDGEFGYVDDKFLKKVEARVQKLEAASIKRLRKSISSKHPPKVIWLSSFVKPVLHQETKIKKTGEE